MVTQHSLGAKPFLKWAGGKSQLIPEIADRLPRDIKDKGIIHKYFEPFVGGGAVFFWLAQHYTVKEAYLYDINPEIILAYRTIQSRPKAVIANLVELEKVYHASTEAQRHDLYYAKREEYNNFITGDIPNNAAKRAALLIFLNRTCFNGLFRVNSKGLFNVPHGRYKKPSICDADNLLAVSRLLRGVVIECRDFADCLEKADSRSLVYFDPPYRPISSTARFTAYIKGGFDDEQQRRLKEVCDQLKKRRAKVILSNSDPKNINRNDNFFDELYSKGYTIDRVKATRMINCDATKRGVLKEILVRNY